jgi:hypothetical protein
LLSYGRGKKTRSNGYEGKQQIILLNIQNHILYHVHNILSCLRTVCSICYCGKMRWLTSWRLKEFNNSQAVLY